MTQESKGPLLEPGHVPKSEAEDPDKPKEKSEAAQVAGRNKNSGLQAQCGEEVTFDVDVAARWVGEHYPVTSIEDLAHGSQRVTMRVSEPAFLERLLLCVGPHITNVVGAPQNFSAALSARRLLARYGAQTK